MNASPAFKVKPIVSSFSVLKSAIVRCLAYFDIFSYPLKADELFILIEIPDCCRTDFNIALIELVNDQMIFEEDDYFSISSLNDKIKNRLKGEQKAATVFKKMNRYSKIIASFPFVEGVTVSGSLSKNYMDDRSDIDYFVITKPGRMWLSRTLLILFKKIFLLNSKKYFCVNYFVASDQLLIPDHNIFTATEVSFLLPVYNYSLYNTFKEQNKWVKQFYPNFPERSTDHIVERPFVGIKTGMEKLFSGKLGERLDEYFFKLTLKRWKKKFKHFDESTFDLRMRSRKNVSKHHPNGFQEKVMTQLAQRINDFETKFNVQLINDEYTVYA